MSTEVLPVTVAGAELRAGSLHVAESPPWDLRLVVGKEEYVSVGTDLFESLTQLRRVLEAEELALCVAGCRSDVFPSGMARQMTGGRFAYRLVSRRRPTREDLVDIFESTCCDAVVTIDDQAQSVRRYRDHWQA